METDAMSTGIQWRKSSYSGDQGGECVEIGHMSRTAIAVRDSKNPTGPIITFAPAAFTTFVNWTAAPAD